MRGRDKTPPLFTHTVRSMSEEGESYPPCNLSTTLTERSASYLYTPPSTHIPSDRSHKKVSRLHSTTWVPQVVVITYVMSSSYSSSSWRVVSALQPIYGYITHKKVWFIPHTNTHTHTVNSDSSRIAKRGPYKMNGQKRPYTFKSSPTHRMYQFPNRSDSLPLTPPIHTYIHTESIAKKDIIRSSSSD